MKRSVTALTEAGYVLSDDTVPKSHVWAREQLYLVLLDEVQRGLLDMQQGRTVTVEALRNKYSKSCRW